MNKKIIVALLITISLNTFAQNKNKQEVKVDSKEYRKLKGEGKLDLLKKHYFTYQKEESITPVINKGMSNNKAGVACFGYTDPDSLADPALGGQDDGSTLLLPLPFTFCFYGVNQTGVYLNTNGNITFGAPYSTFSASSFPSASVPGMIAPFWGDFDFTGSSNSSYYYMLTDAAIFHWEDGGYYPAMTDKLNSVELIITDGNSTLLPPGNNVGFFYDHMEWTTGGASGGTGGFGGTAATVGVNQGDGVTYIQIGQFDQPGNAYDGPLGNSDGVDYLDNKSFYFNVCSATNNPPIYTGIDICDTITACVGDTIPFSITFIGDPGEVVIASATALGAQAFNILSNTTGNIAVIDVEIVLGIGTNTITFSAVDDGVPAGSLDINVYIETFPAPLMDFSITPAAYGAAGESSSFNDLSTISGGGTIDEWDWTFGDGIGVDTLSNPSYVYPEGGIYTIELTVTTNNGCVYTYSKDYTVIDDIIAANVMTPNGDGKNDNLVFKYLDLYPGTNPLKVYDRWGTIIYESSDYQNDWGGDKLSEGTYFYILEIEGFNPIKGFFAILGAE